MSICMYVCEVAKHPLLSVVETSGQRKPAIKQFPKKRGGLFCLSTLFKRAVFYKPTLYSGELAGEGLWLWLLAVGCLHFKGTSTALPRQFYYTATKLPRPIFLYIFF